MGRKRVVIMGAAGRDFHDFNVVYRNDPQTEVIAFTATQIPGIDRRHYPRELAGPLYPEGIPVVPEDSLEDLISKKKIDEVVFAYSDVAHEYVMHQASRVLAAGADFTMLGPGEHPSRVLCPGYFGSRGTYRRGQKPDLSIRGRSPYRRGPRPAIIRHPMPYGDLIRQKVQRFATLDDLDRHQATVEEREDYEPHIRRGLVVWAGVDYEAIVEQAEKEASIIVWDGGNNDFSFLRSDLEIVIVDPFRPGHELAYHPGEVNVRRAHVVVINKVNSAPRENVDRVVANIRKVNADAVIVQTDSVISVPGGEQIRGKRVLVVEDGPTLTHGGMATGAGVEAARQFGAAELDRSATVCSGSLGGDLRCLPAPGADPTCPGLLPGSATRPGGHLGGSAGRRGGERDALLPQESHPGRQAPGAGGLRVGRAGRAPALRLPPRFSAQTGAYGLRSTLLPGRRGTPAPPDSGRRRLRPSGGFGRSSFGVSRSRTHQARRRRPSWPSRYPTCPTQRALWPRI